MSDDEPKQSASLNWNVKDFAVLLPLFGTSLAIAWEVGRFSPTGGFNLFGLADHIVAATAALPVALAMGAYYFMSSWLIAATSDQLTAATGRRALVAASLIVPFVVLVFWVRGPHWDAIDGSDLVLFGVLLFILVNQIWLRYPLTGPIGIGFGFAVAILTSLTLSSELVKKGDGAGGRGKGVATISTKTDTYKARVLMAGDRGLLTYRPETKQVLFQRADELISLEVKP